MDFGRIEWLSFTGFLEKGFKQLRFLLKGKVLAPAAAPSFFRGSLCPGAKFSL